MSNQNSQKLARAILAFFPISLFLIITPILHLQVPAWLLISALILFLFLSVELFQNTRNNRIFDPAVKAAVRDRIKSPERAYRKMSKWNRKLFHGNAQRGAISANLKPQTTRTSARQSGAKTDKKQSSGSKSDDSDGGDGEPPRPQQLFSYRTLALLLDCSEKTLRNQVSAGKIQPPIRTIIGPRFTFEQVQTLLSPVKKPEQKQTARPRGRPRIALAVRGGAA